MYSTGNYYLLISEAWLDHQQKELSEKNEQISELLQQQNQSQQIIMSMNQNQKLLVQAKRNWIQRLFGLSEREV